MAGTKGNRRTLYSKMVIKESLIKLLKNNDINKITVTDICKDANINRGTFYAHYTDPMDLFKSIEDEIFDEVVKSIDKNIAQETIESLLIEIFNIIKNNKDLSKVALFDQRDNGLLNRILCITQNKTICEMKCVMKNATPVQLEYLFAYSINGTIGVIKKWLENDMKESPEEIAKIVESIIKSPIDVFS